ncbi:MAG: hypothetical protein KF724_04950 [Phycisphaeraceae bacterium]|nr:hypothetical protein [Phycisphaeraceae bacterium]
MSSKKTIAWLVGGLLLVALVFVIVAVTAGKPKVLQPPPTMAPSPD